MNKETKKIIVLSIVIVFLIVGLIFSVNMLLNSFNSNKKSKMIEYVLVSEVGSNYIKVKNIDSDEEYAIITNEQFKENDFIASYYEEDKEHPDKIEVIASNETVEYINNKVDINENKVTTTTTVKTTTVVSNSTTSKKTTNVEEEVVLEEKFDIVSYSKEQYEKITSEESIEKCKYIFIEFVDFIFYDGEIKGVKFKELTTSAKEKILYYTLLIDNKIDNRFPNYKDSISDKYEDIKEKVIAKYMDLTVKVCTNHEEACEQFKSDFEILKKSCGYTWDIIVKSFKYGYDKSTSYLKNWYEAFSGK